jgi:hypothetical protein
MFLSVLLLAEVTRGETGASSFSYAGLAPSEVRTVPQQPISVGPFVFE